MKRKFILYPAVALALMASASLSSCVDTDEPESLDALRNAKAEEVRANANLLNAQAEVEKAYVAVVNAKAALDQAKVAGEEARSAMEQYKAALDKAEKDQKIAEIQAGSADNIEAAKLDAEKNKLKAEADKITEGDNALLTAKGNAEDAAVEYQKAIDDAKLKLAKEQLAAAFNMARLEAETAAELADATPALQTAYNNWKTAVDELEQAQDKLAKAYAQAVKDPKTKNELVETVAKKEQAVDDAQRALDKFNQQVEEAKAQGWLQGESVWKVLVDEVNGYLAVVDGNKTVKAQAAIKKEKTKDTRDSLQDVVNKLTEKFNGIKQNAVNALENYKKTEVVVEVECKNAELQKCIGDKVTFTDVESSQMENGNPKKLSGEFTYDKDSKKYKSSIKFRNDDIKGITNALNKFKESVNVYATDQLGQNSRAFEAIANKFNSNLTDLRKSVETNSTALKKKWTEAVNEYTKAAAGNDKGKYNTAVGKLQVAVQNLFGDDGYAADPDGWKQFSSLDVYDDKTVEIFTQKELKADNTLTYDQARQKAWGKLGQFGALKQAEYNNQNNDAQVSVLSDADGMVKADGGTIAAVIKNFSDKLSAEQKKVDAFNTNAEGKATYDELQAKTKELNAAKTAATNAETEYNDVDFKSKYAKKLYDFYIDDEDSPIKAAIAAKAIKKEDNGYLTIPTPSAPKALVDAGIIENGNIKTEAALAAMKATKEKELANAKIELEDAKADVANFDLGTYGKKEDIDPLVEAVKEKEANLEKKQAEYEKELSYLGK